MKTQIKDIVIGIFAVIGFTAVVMGFTNQLPEQVNIDGNLIVDGSLEVSGSLTVKGPLILQDIPYYNDPNFDNLPNGSVYKFGSYLLIKQPE